MGGDIPNPWISQRKNERGRFTVDGRRIDDGTKCTLLAVHLVSGEWHLYPHGWGKFGVRLPNTEARRLAQSILDDTE